jgi:hypothetical protein
VVSAVALVVFVALVAYTTITKRDVQHGTAEAREHHLPHPQHAPLLGSHSQLAPEPE